MARPRKQTVDYFPHYCDHKKTMFILEQKYGNDGYSFWFKLLEILGKYEGHFINLSNVGEWEFLTSYTRLTDAMCCEILTLLAKLEAIDDELWEQKIVWSQKFVDGIGDAYRNRKVEVPERPCFLLSKDISNGVSDVRNPQMKLNETKLNNTKKTKSQKVFSDESLEIKLSMYLFKKIKTNDSKVKEPNFQAWAEHMDKLMRIDKREESEIRRVIDFCQNDNFWKSNIQSTNKLREKFSALAIKCGTAKPAEGEFDENGKYADIYNQ